MMKRLLFYFTILSLLNIKNASIIRPFPQKLTTPTPRLSLADSAEWTEYLVREPEGPGTYSFGYDVEDPETGNVQFRTEERTTNGTVSGSYGFLTPEGSIHIVHYIADQLGYRTIIEDGKKSALFNSLFKSKTPPYDKISPVMLAALQSLQNFNRIPKEDQRTRPVSQEKINSGIPLTTDNIINNNNNNRRDYNIYYVPGN